MGDLEVFGVGVTPFAQYISQVIDLGEAANFGPVDVYGHIDGNAQAQFSTKTGFVRHGLALLPPDGHSRGIGGSGPSGFRPHTRPLVCRCHPRKRPRLECLVAALRRAPRVPDQFAGQPALPPVPIQAPVEQLARQSRHRLGGLQLHGASPRRFGPSPKSARPRPRSGQKTNLPITCARSSRAAIAASTP